MADLSNDDAGQKLVDQVGSARESSPLDVPGVDLGLTADEIVEFVREGRRRVNSAALGVRRERG